MILVYFTAGIADVDVDHAASHVGKAQGIVTMLRSVPYNAQRGSCNIPVQSMIEVIFLEMCTMEKFTKQEGNLNVDCVPRGAIVSIPGGGGLVGVQSQRRYSIQELSSSSHSR